jgi:hypothetical protein
MNLNIFEKNLYQKFSSHINPQILLGSTIMGFLFCCFLGNRVQKIDIFGPNFIRMQGPESYFYPSLSFLVSHVEKTIIKSSQIAIIVGGSSVMFGTAQKANEVWTLHLQKLLGEKYKVYNFALRAGAIQDIASHVSETLLKRGFKVIYVSDSQTTPINLPLGSHSGYSFWYAHFRNWIFNSEKRLRLIEESFKNTKNENELIELKIRGAINSRIFSDDLWNYVGYKHFFTSWTPYNNDKKPHTWSPIKLIKDDEALHLHRSTVEKFEKYFDLKTETLKLASVANQACTNSKDINEEIFTQSSKISFDNLNQWLSPELKKVIHIVLNYEARYYFDHLSPELQKCYEKTWQFSSKEFFNNRINNTIFNQNTDYDDNNDRTHLTASGGMKLASKLAPALKKQAASIYGNEYQ